MRIGEPARRHGVPDKDIAHATRTAIRKVEMDEDLTMLIGPATDGALLEIGVFGSRRRGPGGHPCDAATTEVLQTAGRKVNQTRHTDEQIEQAAAHFEQLADDLDPDTVHAEETDDLRQVAIASDVVRDDEARLREAVQLARAHGRSWNQIAVALGVSRQAARQRFADKVASHLTVSPARGSSIRAGRAENQGSPAVVVEHGDGGRAIST